MSAKAILEWLATPPQPLRQCHVNDLFIFFFGNRFERGLNSLEKKVVNQKVIFIFTSL